MSPNSDRFRVLRRLPEIKFEDELRGYSKSQVDRVLESLAPLADDVDELMARLSEAETRAATAEARLVEHQPGAFAQPEPEPAPVVAAPEPAPAPVVEQKPPVDFDETLRNTLMLAQRTADTTVREANDEAARLRTEAAAEVERTRAAGAEEAATIREDNERTRAELAESVEAERAQLAEDLRIETETRREQLEAELETAHGEERTALLAQIDELQRTRDILNGDIDTLARHLDARRNAIRRAVEELTLALDDPERLNEVSVPDLQAGDDVDPANYAPISLGVEAPAAPESSALVLGEADHHGGHAPSASQVDAGPAPEAVGDATQAFDVLTMDDDGDLAGDPITDDRLADDVEIVPAAPAESPAVSVVDANPPVVTAAPAVAEPETVIESTTGVSDPWAPADPATPGAMQEAADRPAWADSVPTDDEIAPVQSGGPDPFLDELRRVTDAEAEPDADDEALSRFLSDDPDDDDAGRGGWFGRKR